MLQGNKPLTGIIAGSSIAVLEHWESFLQIFELGFSISFIL
jgi:hypothetical protein